MGNNTNVKSLAKAIFRWGVIASSGLFGVWQLIECGRGLLRWNGDWFVFFVLLIFPLAIAAPCLAIAFFCLRRQYRKLFLILGFIGSIGIFWELTALPDQLGVFQYSDRHPHEDHFLVILGLPLAFLFLFGPSFAAAWFFHWCHRLSLPLPERTKIQKTQATRSLVWLGILCLAASLIPVYVALNEMMQSPKALSPESISKALDWIIGLSVIGFLLMFLGLVRRQPISNLEENAPPPDSSGEEAT